MGAGARGVGVSSWQVELCCHRSWSPPESELLTGRILQGELELELEPEPPVVYMGCVAGARQSVRDRKSVV